MVGDPSTRDALQSANGVDTRDVPDVGFASTSSKLVPYEGTLISELGDYTVFRITGGKARRVTPCTGAKVYWVPSNALATNHISKVD
jgi:hypothetical protein